MFGLFGGKDKKNKKKGKAGAAAEGDVRAQALAQFRKTRAELGEETIQAMQKAIQLEEAKKKIRSAVDDDGRREEVYAHLRDILDEDKK